MAVVPLTIPEMSAESLDKSKSSRWSPEVVSTIVMHDCSKSKPWKLKYENIKYENGRCAATWVCPKPAETQGYRSRPRLSMQR